MHDPNNNTDNTKESQDVLLDLTNGDIGIENPQGDVAFFYDLPNLQNLIWRQG